VKAQVDAAGNVIKHGARFRRVPSRYFFAAQAEKAAREWQIFLGAESRWSRHSQRVAPSASSGLHFRWRAHANGPNNPTPLEPAKLDSNQSIFV